MEIDLNPYTFMPNPHSTFYPIFQTEYNFIRWDDGLNFVPYYSLPNYVPLPLQGFQYTHSRKTAAITDLSIEYRLINISNILYDSFCINGLDAPYNYWYGYFYQWEFIHHV